ncbi:class I SAM-dependent methyltransferase [Candidatus Margulisiibacteriota bacterium]
MICQHSKSNLLQQINGEVLFSCNECSSIYKKTNIDPQDHYKDFYKNEIATRFHSPIEILIRGFRFFRAFKIFTLYPGAKRILDVGCGRGYLLYYLKKIFHYEVADGTQISKNAVDFARNTLKLNIYANDLLQLKLKPDSYDIVSLWHVLEHVKNPEEYVKEIMNILKPNGKIIIEVPNFNSWTRPITGKYWLGLDLKNHIHFFTPNTLINLLRKYKYKINKVHTYSLEYSTFISTESLVSRITNSEQKFYKAIQGKGSYHKILHHILLFLLLAPIFFIINGLLFFSKRGEVLLVIARKNES